MEVVVPPAEQFLGDVVERGEDDRAGFVVAARELSPGARAALRDAGVGWVDETGAAEFALAGVVVSRTGDPFRCPDRPRGGHHRCLRWRRRCSWGRNRNASTVPSLQAAAELAGLRRIEGGRLSLLPFPTVTTDCLATVTDGLRVAPWPRVYADLRSVGVRGEDTAENLW